MPKIVIEIEKEDLVAMYCAYRSERGMVPQCIEIQQILKEQRERIDNLVLPLITK